MTDSDPAPTDEARLLAETAFRLRHLIGCVVLDDVELELTLRTTSTTLHLGTDAVLKEPRDFGRLLDRCKKRVRAGIDGVDADLAADFLRALDTAGDAHEERNRVVHDHWFLGYVGSPVKDITVTRQLGNLAISQDKKTLAFVENCRHNLGRARIMVMMIDCFLPHSIALMSLTGEELRGERAVLRGNFDLFPDGTWQPRPPA